jgi:ribosomal protein S18 acetylase RimI-like enzyme
MVQEYTIRPATLADLVPMSALLPELADFDIPPRRIPEDLWHGDAQLLKDALEGETDSSFAHVAATQDDTIVGLTLVTMRDELMSHAPSAHLEAIVVSPNVRGTGLGRRLLAHAEAEVKARGAQSLSLHVFAANHRARGLYNAEGFDSELIRAIKWFD